MKNKLILSAMIGMFLSVGCIIGDELTTITIRPDGSADWVRFKSNVRSSERGEKRAEELSKFIEGFDSHTGPDFAHIVESGGELVDAVWIRAEEPYSTLIKARFPTAASLEKFWTIKSEEGEVLAQARFIHDSNRRRLSLTIRGSRQQNMEPKEPITLKELRENQANSISEARIAVTDGQIVASEGFVVAADKQSCLMDSSRIDELLRSTTGDVELFLEWEVTSK